MYRRRKYRQKRGRGLLGADWPKIYKRLHPYLKKRKQTGGSWGSIFNWGIKKLASPSSNRLAKFLNNPSSGIKFVKKINRII